MRKILASLCLAAVFMLGVIVARWSAPTAAESYVDRRAWVLGEAALRTPQGLVLVIGDSITERSGLTELCGLAVFNAGVSMARVQDVAQMGPTVAKTLKPSKTFLAIGTNDARLKVDPLEFEKQYAALVDSLPQPLILVPLAPGAERSVYNAAIARVGKARALPTLVPFAYEVSDGLHPSPTGAQVWRAQLERGCL